MIVNNIVNYFSHEKIWKTLYSIFVSICAGITAFSVFLIFFEEDSLRILSPFLGFFPALITFSIYLFLAFFSLLYIPLQIKKVSWRAFIPLTINVITFLIVYYFYDSIGDLRIDIGFQINERRFNQVANWITQSIQNGDLIIEEGKEETVFLPEEYRNLTDRDRVYVTQENGSIRIFFNRGGGGFEYYPGYMYHSTNITPPIEDGDIVCIRRIKPNWYDCY